MEIRVDPLNQLLFEYEEEIHKLEICERLMSRTLVEVERQRRVVRQRGESVSLQDAVRYGEVLFKLAQIRKELERAHEQHRQLVRETEEQLLASSS